MVKGISRRVVVVRPESGGPFEQAIFLVRDPAFPRGDAVREACRIAEG
ncbi:translation initiation factor 2, partial [Butyricicoccus sp. AM42-5AC]